MNLKLSILLLLSFSLFSCQADEISSVEPKVINVKEVIEMEEALDVVYISDPLMPYYIMLDEDYIIGNHRIEMNDTLVLPFIEAQRINNIKIISEASFELKLLVEDKVHNIIVEKGENVFDIFSDNLVDKIEVTLVSGSENSFPIDTILIEGYHQLTQEAYENYKVHKKWMSDLHLALEWQDDPMENLKLIPELKEMYNSEQLMIYGEAVDFQQLESSPETCIGYPILITGPVESYEVYDEYSKVTIKSGLTNKSIVVYLDDFQKDIEFLNVIGIFLGYDEHLKFHSSSILK